MKQAPASRAFSRSIMHEAPHLSSLDRQERASAPDWGLRFHALLAVVFLWRLLYIFIVPLDLVPDEAYYWDWSRQLDWGYYSKPPMIAWIDALSTRLFGSSAFVVRLPAVILGTLGIWALFLLARRLYDPRVAFWSGAAAMASPGNSALNVIMTIDAPLVCLWSLSLYTLWRTIERREDNGVWWFASALTVGLGILSKQMMLVFLLLSVVFLLTDREERAHLKRPWPYLLFALSLAMSIPVLWWNMQHGWITFHHTAHHFAGEERGGFSFWKTFLDFLGSQLLLISPVTGLLLALVSGGLLLRFPKVDRPARYLLMFGAAPLVVFVLMSLRQGINANWPAAFYPAGMVPLAAWGCGLLSCGKRLDRWRRLFLPGVAIGAVLAVLTYSLPFAMEASRFGGGPLDPTVRLKGWRELGQEVVGVLQGLPRRDETFLLATKRQLTSELAFYVPGGPPVYRWPGAGGVVRSQYEVWGGPWQKVGWDSLILIDASEQLPSEIAACFSSVTPLRQVLVPLGRQGARRYSLYLGRSLTCWPK